MSLLILQDLIETFQFPPQPFHFVIAALKFRKNTPNRDEISSLKYICVVKTFTFNNAKKMQQNGCMYFFRIWHAYESDENTNYRLNDYILVHPIKNVSNSTQLKQYIADYNYYTIPIPDHIRENEYGKISEEPTKYELIKSKIINKIKTNNINTNFKIFGHAQLPGQCLANHINRIYLNYNLFDSKELISFSDIETENNLILSMCSCDTNFDAQDYCFQQIKIFLKENGISDIPSWFNVPNIPEYNIKVPDSYKNDLHELYKECFFDVRRYYKLNKIIKMGSYKRMLEKQYSKLMRCIQDSDLGLYYFKGNRHLIEIICCYCIYIEYNVSQITLQERRIEFWKEKMNGLMGKYDQTLIEDTINGDKVKKWEFPVATFSNDMKTNLEYQEQKIDVVAIGRVPRVQLADIKKSVI